MERGASGLRAKRWKQWLDRALSLVTALVVALTVFILVNDRVLPALQRDPASVAVGGEVAESFRFEPLAAGQGGGWGEAAFEVPGRGPTLLFVFSSTCAACYANVPAWRRALAAAAGRARVLAVGLERNRDSAASYARQHLAEASAVIPNEPSRFANTFGVDVVPHTALVDGSGVLRFSWPGRLDSAAVFTLERALEALAGS